MGKRKLSKAKASAKAHVNGVMNKVEFKNKTKKLKQNLNNLKKENSSVLTTAINKVKKVKIEKPKLIENIGEQIKKRIVIDKKVETIKKKTNKLKKQLKNKLELNPTNEDTSLVTPKKKQNNKKLKVKKKDISVNVKKLQDKIGMNEKLLKIKKLKKKKDTQNLLEHAETASFTTPVKNQLKGNKSRNISPTTYQKRKKQLKILEEFVSKQPQNKPPLTLRQKMMEKLEAARFRFLNEQIYTTNGKEAEKLFKTDPSAFQAYHKGFRQQVNRWPMNPLDKVIKMIKKMPSNLVIADFGCGDAKLAQTVPHMVHSFDLVAANERVTACNMAHLPLENDSVDVAVFCLSLMGTNLKEYLVEANRVLKSGGLLKVVEVESRFDNVDDFAKICKSYGFVKTWMDLSHNLFYFLDFKKTANVKDRKKLPEISLKPCIYKKR